MKCRTLIGIMTVGSRGERCGVGVGVIRKAIDGKNTDTTIVAAVGRLSMTTLATTPPTNTTGKTAIKTALGGSIIVVVGVGVEQEEVAAAEEATTTTAQGPLVGQAIKEVMGVGIIGHNCGHECCMIQARIKFCKNCNV
eukprot:Platyproteum_vivax@DN414_c0_g1_i1.p2